MRERGFRPRLLGRDAEKLRAYAAAHSEASYEFRAASVDDPVALDRALTGAAALVNCAGPFASTAAPLIEAALRLGIPYVDLAAEIEANVDTLTYFADRARAAGIAVVPAMAFFGGLGDLLVTMAMGDDWARADEAHIAYGLNSWHPTAGTLASGAVSSARRDGRGVRYTGGRLEYYRDVADLPTVPWEFPAPLGTRPVLAGFTMADVVTIPSHLPIPEVCTYMTVAAAEDLAAADTSARAAVDERGWATQKFTVDVIVRSGGAQRRVVASGGDIYSTSATMAAEAVHRILGGQTRTTGAATAGEIFDAPDFLRALAAYITLGPRP